MSDPAAEPAAVAEDLNLADLDPPSGSAQVPGRPPLRGRGGPHHHLRTHGPAEEPQQPQHHRQQERPSLPPRKATPMPPLTLQHFSFHCPGLTGPGAQTSITNRHFGHETLLSRPQPLVIPLFQRRYCWEADQADRWFRDMLTPSAAYGVAGRHGVGKIIVKERDDALWILDGQQRLTTSSLMLAAIRDAALSELRGNTAAADDDDRALLNATVDGCNAHLFLDPAGFEAWAVEQSKAIRDVGAADHDAAWQAVLDGRAAEYEALPHTRLVPSLSDRRPFSELVGAGMVSAALGTAHAALGVSAEAEASAMGQMKRRFTDAIAAWLESAPDSPAERLSHLLKRSLQHMYVVLVDVKSDVNLALVFLWMQEKTLFGMGVFLENPSPGKVFHAADLTRNLFLAPFMDDGQDAQERRYRELWLEPFERRLARPGESNERRLERMDACICEYIEIATGEAQGRVTTDELKAPHPSSSSSPPSSAAAKRRHVSAFEQQAGEAIKRFAEHDFTKYDYTGIAVYTRLYSLYEERCAAWRKAHAPPDTPPASQPCPDAEAAVALEILTEIGAVAVDA